MRSSTDPASSGVVPRTTTRPLGARLRRVGWKNVKSCSRPRVGDAGSVEDECAELRVGRLGERVVAQEVADRFDQAAVAAEQDGAGERGLAGLVAPELLGLWQTELLGEERSGCGRDELGVELGCALGFGHDSTFFDSVVGAVFDSKRVRQQTYP